MSGDSWTDADDLAVFMLTASPDDRAAFRAAVLDRLRESGHGAIADKLTGGES